MEPERRRAIAEQGVVEGPERKRFALLLLVVLPQLQQHHLARAVDEIRWIEAAALGRSPRARLLQIGFLAEPADALFDGHVLGVQLDADDEADQANQRFSELAQLNAVVMPRESRLDHHL